MNLGGRGQGTIQMKWSYNSVPQVHLALPVLAEVSADIKAERQLRPGARPGADLGAEVYQPTSKPKGN